MQCEVTDCPHRGVNACLPPACPRPSLPLCHHRFSDGTPADDACVCVGGGGTFSLHITPPTLVSQDGCYSPYTWGATINRAHTHFSLLPASLAVFLPMSLHQAFCNVLVMGGGCGPGRGPGHGPGRGPGRGHGRSPKTEGAKTARHSGRTESERELGVTVLLKNDNGSAWVSRQREEPIYRATLPKTGCLTYRRQKSGFSFSSQKCGILFCEILSYLNRD